VTLSKTVLNRVSRLLLLLLLLLLLWFWLPLLLPGLMLLLLLLKRGEDGESRVEELRLVSRVLVDPPQASPARLPLDTAALSCSSRLFRFCSMLRRISSFKDELPAKEFRFMVPNGEGVSVPVAAGEVRKLKPPAPPALLFGVAGVQDKGFT